MPEPISGDGYVEVPATQLENQAMDVVEEAMKQDFLAERKRLNMIAERSADSSTFVKARAEESFLQESQLVGALAASRLDQDGLAKAVLQNNAARDQPGQNVK